MNRLDDSNLHALQHRGTRNTSTAPDWVGFARGDQTPDGSQEQSEEVNMHVQSQLQHIGLESVPRNTRYQSVYDRVASNSRKTFSSGSSSSITHAGSKVYSLMQRWFFSSSAHFNDSWNHAHRAFKELCPCSSNLDLRK